MTLRNLARPIGFATTVVVIVVAILVTGAKSPPAPASAARVARPQTPQDSGKPLPSVPGAQSAAPARPLVRAETAAAGPAKQDAVPPAPRPAPSAKRTLSYGALPPLMVAPAGSEMGTQGPPPNVLWLSGIIQGSPKLAVIRRGEERYMVREGESVGGAYRVSKITASAVTLQRGRRTLLLRLGQFS